MPRDEMLQWMADERWSEEPETFLHPFADPRVMAGHGGLALDSSRTFRTSRACWSRSAGWPHRRHRVSAQGPATRGRGDRRAVDGYTLWTKSLEAGGPVPIKPDTIADGTTAPFDARMFELVQECVDRWLTVPEPRLRSAIPELASAAKVVAEGAAL